MTEVFVTKRGHVYHARLDCEWLMHSKQNAQRVGRNVHPTRVVKLAFTRRKPCRVCVGWEDKP